MIFIFLLVAFILAVLWIKKIQPFYSSPKSIYIIINYHMLKTFLKCPIKNYKCIWIFISRKLNNYTFAQLFQFPGYWNTIGVLFRKKIVIFLLRFSLMAHELCQEGQISALAVQLKSNSFVNHRSWVLYGCVSNWI